MYVLKTGYEPTEQTPSKVSYDFWADLPPELRKLYVESDED